MADTIEPNPVINAVLDTIEDKRKMGEGIKGLSARMAEFSSPYEMRLAGAAMIPAARDMLNESLTAMFANTSLPLSFSGRELIVGAGYSAAVYSAVRVRSGFPKPIVFDMAPADRIGGAFAMSLQPVFRLNSGNRPGKVGSPGDLMASLNYIPGAVIQPSMLSSENYQTNADMALAIRLCLAQFADVIPGTKVSRINGSAVTLESGGEFTFKRVIEATGLGQSNFQSSCNGTTVLSFEQFMQRMGGLFPLQGLRKVAVVGDGDSAKCAVESLMGIAPGHSSLAGLDFVRQVDWFAPNLPTSKQGWKDTQRGRYFGICNFLGKRVFIKKSNATFASTFEGAIVNGLPYDAVIVCAGNRIPDLGQEYERNDDNTALVGEYGSGESYKIGAGCMFPFSRAETDAGIGTIPANRVAMFRYAPRIAALASQLS